MYNIIVCTLSTYLQCANISVSFTRKTTDDHNDALFKIINDQLTRCCLNCWTMGTSVEDAPIWEKIMLPVHSLWLCFIHLNPTKSTH